MSLRGFLFGGPRTPEPLPVVDGVPCRPCGAAEYPATISAMLLRRLILAALVGAALSFAIPLAITWLTVGTAASASDVPVLAHVAGSPLAFACYLLGVDLLLVRGRLARALAVLTWTQRRTLRELRESTGLRRATDRVGARDWLANHPASPGEGPALAASRVRLQLLTGDADGARDSVARLRQDHPDRQLEADVLEASVDLAGGQPFNATALKAQVDTVADPDRRAELAAETAARIAEGRLTCQGDHLDAMAWAFDRVGTRDAGLLLRAYWLPIIVLVLATALVLAFLLPVAG